MTLQVLIGGIDRTLNIDARSFKKEDQINNKVDTCTFDIKKYGTTKTYAPATGDEVIVYRDGDKIFGGVILTVDEDMIADSVLIFKVKCKDYSHFLDRKLVLDRYTNMTAEDIIEDIITEYTTGFTTTNVIANINIASIAFNRIPVTAALDKIAKLLNYSWYVDYNKDIHFFAKNTEAASFNITDNNGNYIPDSLSITSDFSQIRNRVTIEGGEAPSNSRTVTQDLDGTKKQWATIYKFESEPTVTVGGVAKTVGLDGIDDELAYDFLWNYNGRYLRSATAWTGGANALAMTGVPLLPIVVQISDSQSIAKYGIYEFARENKSIRTRQEAIDFAFAELEAYAETIKEGEFITYNESLRSGQVITITSALRGISESFVIQKVTMTVIANSTAIYKVTLATLRTIGMIDVLQGLLAKEEIKQGETEGLLTFIPLEDEATATDQLVSVTTSTGPYTWEDEAATPDAQSIQWNFFTWEA